MIRTLNYADIWKALSCLYNLYCTTKIEVRHFKRWVSVQHNCHWRHRFSLFFMHTPRQCFVFVLTAEVHSSALGRTRRTISHRWQDSPGMLACKIPCSKSEACVPEWCISGSKKGCTVSCNCSDSFYSRSLHVWPWLWRSWPPSLAPAFPFPSISVLSFCREPVGCAFLPLRRPGLRRRYRRPSYRLPKRSLQEF